MRNENSERWLYDSLRRLAGLQHKYPPRIWREYSRLIRLAFPRRPRTAYREWVKRNPNGPALAIKRFRMHHPMRAKLQLKQSRKRHLGNVLAKNARRRAKRQGATCGNLCEIRRIYNRCQELRKWFDVVVDHIIPLSKGGLHAADNLQIIYAFENNQKGIRLDYQPSVVFR